MSHVLRGAALGVAAVVFTAALASDVAARGGRGGGGSGLSRGGVAATGSFGRSSGSRSSGRANIARDRASSGDFGRYRDERLERREDRQEHREERREDWQDYAEDHHGDYYYGYYYDDYYDDGYYYEDEFVEEIYDRLPCVPLLKTRGGTTYYQCRSDWYVKAYVDGDVVYVSVPPPTAR